MPDISKCKNEECPSKNECYRYTVEPSDYQSYASFNPEKGEDKCGYYWDNKAYKNEVGKYR